MIQKMKINDTENRVKDSKALDEMILNVLKENRVARRKDLISNLSSNNLHGIATINRHLGKLEKENKIKRINPKKYQPYGITEEDKKAVFFVLPSDSEESKYHDMVISALNSKDKKKRKNALIEIESFEHIKLLPKQLTNLSSALTKETEKECWDIIRILKKHFEEGILPSDLVKFQKNIIFCFKKYQLAKAKNFNLRSHILTILGILNNEIILDFLESDLEKFPHLEIIEQQYSNLYLFEIINKNKSRLFKLSTNLSPENNSVIAKIRRKANEKNETYDLVIEKLKERIEQQSNKK